jgi:UDP-hydrolysing UDP-N-acetyl-D-glucosamine 2-epimerase
VKKLLTILSSRASYSRVRSVLAALKKTSSIDSHLMLIASAASNKYGNLESFLQKDEIRVNWKVESQSDANLVSSMVKTTASSLSSISDYILNFNIDGVLIIADRHETLAGAVAGSYLNRRVFHLLGGEKSGNIDHKVRYANSFLSDYHFVATPKSKSRLEECGISSSTIFNTGCPSLDFMAEAALEDRDNFANALGGVGYETEKLFKSKYIVVIQHAETTNDLNPIEQIRVTIDAINKINMPTLWIWPNADYGSDAIIREISRNRDKGYLKSVHFERSIEPKLFLAILKNASCVVGNSSVSIRECSLLGVPAVNIGTRQLERERANNVIDSEFNERDVFDSIKLQVMKNAYTPSNLYGDGKSGMRIANLIEKLLV